MKTFIILFVCIAATLADLTFQESFEKCVAISNNETKILLNQVAKKCVNNLSATDRAAIMKQCEANAIRVVTDEMTKADKCIDNIHGIHFAQNILVNINKTLSAQIQQDIKRAVSQCMNKPGNAAIQCFERAINEGIQKVHRFILNEEKKYLLQFKNAIENCVRKEENNATRILNSLIPKCEKVGKVACKNSTRTLIKSFIAESGKCVKNINNPAKIDAALVTSINAQIQKSMIVFVNKAIDECFAKNIESAITNCLRSEIAKGIAEVNKQVTAFEKRFIGTTTTLAASTDNTFQQKFQDCVAISESETKNLLNVLVKICAKNTAAPDVENKKKECADNAIEIFNSEIFKTIKCVNDIYGINFDQNVIATINRTHSAEINKVTKETVNQCMNKTETDSLECFEAAIESGVQSARDFMYATEKKFIQELETEIASCVSKEEKNATITLNNLIPNCEKIGKEACKNNTVELLNGLIIEAGVCVKNITSPAQICPALVTTVNSHMQHAMVVYVSCAIDECFAKNKPSDFTNCFKTNIKKGIALANRAITEYEMTFIGMSTNVLRSFSLQ